MAHSIDSTGSSGGGSSGGAGAGGRRHRVIPLVAAAVAVSLATALAGAGTAGAAGPPGAAVHRAAGGAGGGGGDVPMVVGGADAQPGQFPWMVRLSMGCGGAVVAARAVLTAAHCVAATGYDTSITATIGRTRLSAPGGEMIQSSYVVRSPRYATEGTDDWALVELSRPTTTPPIPLVAQGDTSLNGGYFAILGWGSLYEGGPQSDTLRYARVPFVDDATCGQAYGTRFHPATEMCAGYPQGGVDTCQGDSGGPMARYVAGRWIEVGTVSYGRGCAEPGYPGVYGEVEAFSGEITSRLTPYGGVVH